MTFERRRTALMNKSCNWGDPVEARPHGTTIPSGTNSPSSPNDSRASPSSSETSLASNTPSTTITTGGGGSISSSNLNATDMGMWEAREDRRTDFDGDSDSGASLLVDATTTSSGSDRPMAMTSTRGWSLSDLIKQSPRNFRPVPRVSATVENLEKIMKRFEDTGKPLVIEGYQHHSKWPHKMFNAEYFQRNASDEISVRNVHNWTDTTMKLSDFLEKSRSIGPYTDENEQERYYGKDSECPQPWENWLQTAGVIPSSLLGNGPNDLFRYLPESVSVQTLMCYVGIGDTFTPCHKDLCASSGQNLMCYTENNGSSFWFMTKGSDAAEVAKYFQAIGQELDHENHVVTLKELADAPFKVYIVEQKLGDLVLVPPRSCHQVVNFGGITIKTSWSRMTLKGLATAYHHELPVYRRACRPEIYRVKSTIHHALIALTKQLEDLLNTRPNSSTLFVGVEASTEETLNEVKALLSLYECILVEENAPNNEKMRRVVSKSGDCDDKDHLACDFCGSDIFQSFFECRQCIEGEPSTGNRLHICAGCYVEGRSCKCSSMQPMQYRSFKDLRDVRSKAQKVVRLHKERRDRRTLTASQELPLKNDNVPPLFRAACYLYELRESAKKESKVCTIYRGDEGPHNCPYHWVLSCKHCHNGKCFAHIMSDFYVHSAEALVIHRSDSSHLSYHKVHLNGKQKFQDDESSLEQDQRQGSRHPGYSVLVYNALNFVHCKPVSPRFMELGWYDRKYEILEDEEESGPQALARSSSSEEMDVVDDIVHSQAADQPRDDNDQMVVDPVLPTKKKQPFYVQVPPAPYSIQRALSEYIIGQSSVEMPVKETNPPESSSSSSQSQSQDSPHEPVIESTLTTPLVTSVSVLRNGSQRSKQTVQKDSKPRVPITNSLNRVGNLSSKKTLISFANNSAPKKTPLSHLRFKKLPEGSTNTPSAPTVGASHLEVSHHHENTSQDAPSTPAFPPSSTTSSDSGPPVPQNTSFVTATAPFHSPTTTNDASPSVPQLAPAVTATALPHSSTTSSDAGRLVPQIAPSITAIALPPHLPTTSNDASPSALQTASSFTAAAHSLLSTSSDDTPPLPQVHTAQPANAFSDNVAKYFASNIMHHMGSFFSHTAVQTTQPHPPAQLLPTYQPPPMPYNMNRYADTSGIYGFCHDASSSSPSRQGWGEGDELGWRTTPHKRKSFQGSWHEGSNPNAVQAYPSQGYGHPHHKRRFVQTQSSPRPAYYMGPPYEQPSRSHLPYAGSKTPNYRVRVPSASAQASLQDSTAPHKARLERPPANIPHSLSGPDSNIHGSTQWDQQPTAPASEQESRPRCKTRWDQLPQDVQAPVNESRSWGSSPGTEQSRQWTPSPHYHAKRPQQTSYQRNKNGATFSLPRPARHNRASQFEVVANTSRLQSRSRRDMGIVTQMDVMPSVHHTNGESPREPNGRNAVSATTTTTTTTTTVDVSEPRRQPRPMVDLTVKVNHEGSSDPRLDSEMKTPTNELARVGNDETFPSSRNDADRLWSPTEQVTQVRNGVQVAGASNDLEMRSPTEDVPHDADEEWEDSYDQSDEHEPSPRQEFRNDLNKDDDIVSLGTDDGYVTPNPWAS